MFLWPQTVEDIGLMQLVRGSTTKTSIEVSIFWHCMIFRNMGRRLRFKFSLSWYPVFCSGLAWSSGEKPHFLAPESQDFTCAFFGTPHHRIIRNVLLEGAEKEILQNFCRHLRKYVLWADCCWKIDILCYERFRSCTCRTATELPSTNVRKTIPCSQGMQNILSSISWIRNWWMLWQTEIRSWHRPFNSYRRCSSEL